MTIITVIFKALFWPHNGHKWLGADLIQLNKIIINDNNTIVRPYHIVIIVAMVT